MPGAIKRYANNVFTNDGQSDVSGFAAKLTQDVRAALNSAGSLEQPLQVYAGYHGTAADAMQPAGNFLKAFDQQEMEQVAQMATQFINIQLCEIQENMSDQAIQDAVARGNVFFTWCDSNARVKRLMGVNMPAEVPMV